jgi:hypothetical protein
MMEPNPNNPPRPPPSALAMPPDAVCFNRPVNTLPVEELVDPALDGLPNASAVPSGLAPIERDLVALLRLDIFDDEVDEPLSGCTSLLEILVLLLGSKGFLEVAILSFRSPFLL